MLKSSFSIGQFEKHKRFCYESCLCYAATIVTKKCYQELDATVVVINTKVFSVIENKIKFLISVQATFKNGKVPNLI